MPVIGQKVYKKMTNHSANNTIQRTTTDLLFAVPLLQRLATTVPLQEYLRSGSASCFFVLAGQAFLSVMMALRSAS